MTIEMKTYYTYESDKNGVYSLKEKHLSNPDANCFTTKEQATCHFTTAKNRAIEKYNIIINRFNELRRKCPSHDKSLPKKTRTLAFIINGYQFQFPMEIEIDQTYGFMYKQL